MPRAVLDPAGPFARHPLEPHRLVDRVTRTEDTIVLCHLGIPRIVPDAWTLTIDGLVRHPLCLTPSDIEKRPRVSIVSVHQCCGSPLQPEVPTRRICNVVWTGARLSEILAEAEPEPGACYVWSSGADYGIFQGESCEAYVKDLPLDRIFADVLIAYEMNGAPLRPENGYPARLVVPGYYGTNSVKWLTRMTLAATRAPGPFTTRWYNDPIRDASGLPTGECLPVRSIAPESVIVSPAPDRVLAAGREIEIWGWAWADGGVSSVSVSTDRECPWLPAAVEPPADHAWQRFSVIWRPERPGKQEIRSRAFSADGRCQPESGARNSIHHISIEVV